MAKTKLSIRDNIERCQKRERRDILIIWLLGSISIPGLTVSFRDDLSVLGAILPLGVLVLTFVALFCRRIWTVRRLEWERLLALCALNDLLTASLTDQRAL